MVGRENNRLFCHSLYGDLYGDARFGAVRRIRVQRWVLRGNAHAGRRTTTACGVAGKRGVTPPD